MTDPAAGLDPGSLRGLSEDALDERLRAFANEHGAGALPALSGLAESSADRSVRRAAKRALYRLGQCTFEAHVLMAWADAGASPEDPRWRQALTLADRWPVPEFPVRGPDIMALGDLKGPVIGDILRELEQGWIGGGFAEDREQLLAKAAKLASKAG